MDSTRRSSSQAKSARPTFIQELESSNLTTAAFLGGKQKDWMTGGNLLLASNMSTGRTSSGPDSSLHAAPIPQHSPQNFISTSQNASPSAPSPSVPSSTGFDRGRFPAQRRRRGGTMSYPNRHSNSAGRAALDKSKPVSPTPRTESSVLSKEDVTHVSNLLPSPSPSIESRRPSHNIVDLEDQTTEAIIGTTGQRTRLEDLIAQHGGIDALETKLREIEKLNNGVQQQGKSPRSEISAEDPPTTIPAVDTDIVSRPESGAAAHSLANPADSTYRSSRTDDQQISLQAVSTEGQPDSTIQKGPLEDPLASEKRVQDRSESITEDSGSCHSSQSGPNDHSLQTIPSTNTTFELEIKLFREKVVHRIATLSGRSLPMSSIERPRLDLLCDACAKTDCFYLSLHQLYCLDSLREHAGSIRLNLQKSHHDGLATLSYLLVRNDELGTAAIRWFSEFPLPINVLHSGRPIFVAAYWKVLACLSKFSTDWQSFHARCEARRCPPLVDELFDIFGAESFTLQRVIFRAIMRDVWPGIQDQCSQQADNVFLHDYKEVMSRRSANPAIDTVEAQQRAVLTAYQKIRHNHHQQNALQKNVRNASYYGQRQANVEAMQHQANQRRGSRTPRTSTVADQSALASVSGNPLGQRNYSNPSFTNTASSIPPSTTDPLPSKNPSAPQYQGARRNPLIDEQRGREAANQSAPTNMSFAPVMLPSNFSRQGPHGSQSNGTRQPPRPLRVQTAPTNADVHQTIQPQFPFPGTPRHLLEVQQQIQTPSFNHAPFIRANPNINQLQANPALNALHQVHVRSPPAVSLTLQGTKNDVSKVYRYIIRVLMPPGELSTTKKHVKWDFDLDKTTFDMLAKDAPGLNGAPPTRTLLPGSISCRVRCIKSTSPARLRSESEWVAADNVWPGSTAIVLNGKALEIRKKSHHGKDLPIDITSYVKEGQNSISTAIIGLPEGSTPKYVIGVEIIQVTERHTIENNIKYSNNLVSRQRILDRFTDTDPDIQVVNSQIIIDLTDPFSAKTCKIPLRGTHCRHTQCFDRDIFLQTRNSKNPKDPCGPDDFRCPICGTDARPQSLVVDCYLMEIRNQLYSRDRFDVKAVILYPSGEWEIKEEEEVTGEQGDGSGKRRRQSVRADVIELDDD
ncbi:hypothetical protein ACLMJK_008431 [Lecanora helva]